MVEIIYSRIAVTSLKWMLPNILETKWGCYQSYIKKSSKYFLFSFSLLCFLDMSHAE